MFGRSKKAQARREQEVLREYEESLEKALEEVNQPYRIIREDIDDGEVNRKPSLKPKPTKKRGWL